MEVDIIRREQTGNGPSTYTETDSIGKYEIMDGGPIKGEVIPIRLFLKAFQAQPTMKVKRIKIVNVFIKCFLGSCKKVFCSVLFKFGLSR